MSHSSVLKVFLDTEFTDFIGTDLISIGLVAENGAEFYGENMDFDVRLASEFVKANIYPLLNFEQHGYRRLDLSARLWQWLDELPCDKVEVYCDYPTDWDLLIDLLEDVHPKLLPYTNIFFKLGAQCLITSALAGPDSFTKLNMNARKLFYQEFLNHFYETKASQHHALDDARANCRAYFAALKFLQPSTY